MKAFVEKRIVGVNDEEVPPVPIPNTVVKLLGAENTWLETARENRAMPTFSFFISKIKRDDFAIVSLLLYTEKCGPNQGRTKKCTSLIAAAQYILTHGYDEMGENTF